MIRYTFTYNGSKISVSSCDEVNARILAANILSHDGATPITLILFSAVHDYGHYANLPFPDYLDGG